MCAALIMMGLEIGASGLILVCAALSVMGLEVGDQAWHC